METLKKVLMSNTESDVLYFNTLRQPIVVLNSVEACVDLLDKRGGNYSDRPRFVLLELYVIGLHFQRSSISFMQANVLQE